MRAEKQVNWIPYYNILSTTACNARCVYCYEKGFKNVYMKPETIDQTVQFILKTCNRNKVNILFMGGEPLLRPDIIDRICEGMMKHELSYNSNICTNGSLITPEVINKMKNKWNIRYVQIQIDGTEETYTSRKQYYYYRDYYLSVIQSISKISENGINVCIRCNVDEENWDQAVNLLDDLKTKIVHKENVYFYFSPLFSVRADKNDLSMWKNIRDSHKMIRNAGLQEVSYLWLPKVFRTNYCNADDGSVVIAPDGGIYPCEQYTSEIRMGDVWNGIINEDIRKKYTCVGETRDKCRKCPFLPDCTNFSLCPVKDKQCREVREMMIIDELQHLIEYPDYHKSGFYLIC